MENQMTDQVQGDMPERVRRMIEWLIENAQRIDRIERVQVVFNCAGGKIRTEVVESGEA